MSSSLVAIRASSEANTAEQKRLVERKRNILVLIHEYLVENGYVEAAARLNQESGGVVSKFAAADNIDLDLVLGEYEAYYEMKFGKKPKLSRKTNDEDITKKQPQLPKPVEKKSNKSNDGNDSSSKLPSLVANASNDNMNNFSVSGTSINNNEKKVKDEAPIKLEERLLKPPPQFGGDSELKQLANVISREIYQESPNVRFDDIIQLDEAKRLLIEAVQLPLRFPNVFTGILRPWRGILLHGPPGTGKTLLAKAVATECQTTFFNISASTLVSKWRGDSEKLVRVLFEVARYHAPSTIFLDEIDSILTSRDGDAGGGGEHEASRRMKTELLIQMDGVKGSNKHEQVFVMAASNLPWSLDIAVLRRLEKRVLVGLPSVKAREMMFQKHLSDRSNPNINYNELAIQTEGYSGADLELVCREAAMMPVRRLMKRIDELDRVIPPPETTTTAGSNNGNNAIRPDPPSGGSNNNNNRLQQGHYRSNSKTNNSTKISNNNNNNNSGGDIETLLAEDPVSIDDILKALQTTKSSSDGKITRYEQWQKEFGSV